MTNTSQTKLIMSKVALIEEGRLKRLALVLAPAFLVLFGITFTTFYQALTGILEQGSLELVTTIELDWETLLPQLAIILGFVWEDVEKANLAVFLISLTVVLFLFWKINPRSSLRRLGQLKKYRK